MSIKGYWSIPSTLPTIPEGKAVTDTTKGTSFHCDMMYQKDTVAAEKDNSQQAGTPVFIATYGTSKTLTWARSTGNKLNILAGTQFDMKQNNNSFIILDDDDEKWHQTTPDEIPWRFMHSSTYPTAKKGDMGMTWVIMLRRVTKTVRVLNDHTFKDKNQGREEVFAAMRDKYKTIAGYEDKVKAIKKKLDNLCDSKIY